jgi:hypothetical protein
VLAPTPSPQSSHHSSLGSAIGDFAVPDSSYSVSGSAPEKPGQEFNIREIPWIPMLTHPASLCLLLSNWVFGWIGYMLLTELPSFLNDELGYDIESSGLLSIAPFLANLISVIVFAQIFDHLQVLSSSCSSSPSFLTVFYPLVTPHPRPRRTGPSEGSDKQPRRSPISVPASVSSFAVSSQCQVRWFLVTLTHPIRSCLLLHGLFTPLLWGCTIWNCLLLSWSCFPYNTPPSTHISLSPQISPLGTRQL